MSDVALLNRTWQLSHHFEGEPAPREWDLPRPSPGMFGEFAKHLRHRLILGIKGHRDILDDYDYRVMMESVSQAIIGGEYMPERVRFWEALADTENRKELLRLWIEDCERKDKLAGKDTKRLPLKRKQLDELWAAKNGELWNRAWQEGDGDEKRGLMQQMLREQNPFVQGVKSED